MRDETVERWNYYFERCHGVTITGATVALHGFGIVTFGNEARCEHVLFPEGRVASISFLARCSA